MSALGADSDGAEIRRILSTKKLPDAHIQTDREHPTGRVTVTLHDGKPSYEILGDVPWDFICFDEELRRLAGRFDAVCFGSLAQRNADTRKAIHSFLASMRSDSLRVFDINLRQEFFSREIIEQSLRYANILKLSDEELPVLAEFFKLSGSVDAQLDALRRTFRLRLVAYTMGGEGSLLVAAGETAKHPGFPTQVIDTVGAGDSFTAALCTGLLKNLPLGEINCRSCQFAAFVCSQAGATPLLPRELVASR